MSKKIVSLFLAMLTAFGLSTAMAGPITFTDMFGREVTIAEPAVRVVAMEPSDCEILCAIGCEENIVGRGAYCDYPPSVLELPVLQSGENLNVEEVLALQPQVVFMNGMAYMGEAIAMLEQNGVQVVASDADDIAGTYDSIRMIGRVMGREAEAEAVIADMQQAFDYIAANSEKTDKTIYFEVMPLEWGLWSAGTNTFMQELAELCGMHNAFEDIEGWQAVSQEQVIERNPDFIVLVTGMGESAVDEVLGRDGWGDIEAVKNGKVYNADSYTLTRPAPRLKDAAMELYNFLYDAEQ